MRRVLATALLMTAAACGGASYDGVTYVWDDDKQALVSVEVSGPAVPNTAPANPPPAQGEPPSPGAPAPVSPGGTRADSTPDPIPARPTDPWQRRCDRVADPAEREACRSSEPRVGR
jgi:hypothetical protein